MLNHRKTLRRSRTPISEKSILKIIEEDKKIKKIEITHEYTRRKRLIPQYIYCKLKAQRKCDRCGKEINYPPQLHHIQFKSRGGSNSDIKNLKALCIECHEGIHKEEKYAKQNENQNT